jgi:hypothetical protein
MDARELTPSNQATAPRRRGRPPGAKSKRSLDLARFIEATFAGMTPGQQAARLAMVTPGEVAAATRRAAELQIVHPPRDKLTLAMVVKATELARALNCDRRDAWLLIQKEREGLMAYVHQKQPAASEKPAAPPVLILASEDLGPQILELADDDEALDLLDVSPTASSEVA